VYQLGRGSEPVIVVGNLISLVPRYMRSSPRIRLQRLRPPERSNYTSTSRIELWIGSRLKCR
jgi:hypothetical protein